MDCNYGSRRSLSTWIVSTESCLLYFKSAAPPMHVSRAKRLNAVVKTFVAAQSYLHIHKTEQNKRTWSACANSGSSFFSLRETLWLRLLLLDPGTTFLGAQSPVPLAVPVCTWVAPANEMIQFLKRATSTPFQPFWISAFFFPPIWNGSKPNPPYDPRP